MDIASYAIVGAMVSVMIEVIKKYSGTSSATNVGMVVVAALLVGVGYQYFSHTPYWPTVLQILAYANLFYGFVVKQMQPANP
jgi:hypothetical protein